MRLENEVLLLVHLQLKPRDVDRLTVAEFHRMCAYAEELNRRASR